MAEAKHLLPFLLLVFLGLIGSSVTLPSSVSAQGSYPRVDYYLSPYGNGIHIDAIGYLLGRVGVKYERRSDPLLSNTFEITYQPDIKKKDWKSEIPSYAFGFGQRIYLRDNAAMEGVYFGINGAIAYASSTIHFRVTPEIGYKVMLGSNSPFFLEPMLLYDIYVIRPAGGKPVLPYVALPFGFLW